jgi:Dolichyl-phosphate-mannose-protein mannosyltransferase
MAFSDIQIQPITTSPANAPTKQASSLEHRSRNVVMWLCIVLACLGASWYSTQIFLVPQPARFTSPLQNTQLVQAKDGNGPVAYFRYSTDLNTLPDAAFVTVAAGQIFRLYVNGTFIDTNALDLIQGGRSQAYIYDVLSTLQLGPNVIALRVANLDKQVPTLRASLGLVIGSSIIYRGTGPGWQATAQSTLANPRYIVGVPAWVTPTFDASSWLPAQALAHVPAPPPLTVNPLLFEQALPTQWMSAGASHNAYFVRNFSLPASIAGTWLRIAAAGPASVYLNGQLLIVWNGEAPVPSQQIFDYLSNLETVVHYQKGLLVGLYDISPYLHAGTNTIAVHVAAPGNSAAQTGLNTLSAALSTDILAVDSEGHHTWIASGVDWHVSPEPVSNWEQGDNATQKWPFALSVGRPGATRALYIPQNPTQHNISLLPLSLLATVIALSIEAVVALWLLMSLLVMRCYSLSPIEALEMMSVAYVPALACEILLIVLSREPQIPQPFPYTSQWGMILLLLVGNGYLLLWLNAHRIHDLTTYLLRMPGSQRVVSATTKLHAYVRNTPRVHPLFTWLRVHWGLVVLFLIAIPLSSYNLNYEPYWQDELTSFFAAKGILAHGIPVLPSGFLYAKGELYSYVLALFIAIFGEQNGLLRIPSVLEYLVSLPLFYYVGCYFCNRRVALLATAMLAFSPYTLLWGHEVRMYEQAQLLMILTMYLFYRALRQPQHPRLVYLAVASLVATYLTHEEIFITFPALVVCVLLASAMESRRTASAREQQNDGIGTKRLLPPILYQKHWWCAAALGGGLIGLQLLITKVSHPPILGTDQSQQPLIQVSTDNLAYYFKLLFIPTWLNGSTPWLTLNSLLAVIGCIWAIRRADVRAMFCALLFFISLLTLALFFTLTADRYIYPLLPALYLVGAYALLLILGAVRGLVSSLLAPQQDEQTGASAKAFSQPLRLMIMFTNILVCASVLIMPALPISNYNLFVSRQMDFIYHRHYADYDAVGQYMHDHWRKGDIVISVSPAISILYYVGHVDYFFSIDRALYLFEQDGHMVDTPTGSTPLLSQSDFQAVLASHKRIWILSDNGQYQAGVTKNGRFIFPPDFRVVFEGYGSAIYFRGG